MLIDKELRNSFIIFVFVFCLTHCANYKRMRIEEKTSKKGKHKHFDSHPSFQITPSRYFNFTTVFESNTHELQIIFKTNQKSASSAFKCQNLEIFLPILQFFMTR